MGNVANIASGITVCDTTGGSNNSHQTADQTAGRICSCNIARGVTYSDTAVYLNCPHQSANFDGWDMFMGSLELDENWRRVIMAPHGYLSDLESIKNYL